MDDWTLALRHLNKREGAALLSMIGAKQVGNWFWKTPDGKRYLFLEDSWLTEEDVLSALAEAMNFPNPVTKQAFMTSTLESWRRA